MITIARGKLSAKKQAKIIKRCKAALILKSKLRRIALIREFVENNLPKFSVVIFSLDKAKNAAIA
jgi:hypothetical protein